MGISVFDHVGHVGVPRVAQTCPPAESRANRDLFAMFQPLQMGISVFDHVGHIGVPRVAQTCPPAESRANSAGGRFNHYMHHAQTAGTSAEGKLLKKSHFCSIFYNCSTFSACPKTSRYCDSTVDIITIPL